MQLTTANASEVAASHSPQDAQLWSKSKYSAGSVVVKAADVYSCEPRNADERSLAEGDVLMDISVGQQLLREIMACYDHKNLDLLDT